MRVLLGVSGGIAAYKAVLVLRLLKEAGHSVRVIPTHNALEFVGEPTWAALSGEAVTTSVFDGVTEVDHVRLGREAELVLVVPSTADLLARAAAGRADDLLTTTLLTTQAPVVFAPAMHTEMWRHPATQANVAVLRSRGARVIEPDSGRLTGADSGPGRLPEPEQIVATALEFASSQAAGSSTTRPPAAAAMGRELAGKRVCISSGGTRERIDPVRFIGNRSSGKQGIELAKAASAAGAQVTVVAANIDSAILAELPHHIDVVPVSSTAELEAEMTARAQVSDAVIMAAAVADFRPKQASQAKVKKHADGSVAAIELVENPDILASLAARAGRDYFVVGFAAETGDENGSVLDHGRAKARRKGADLLVINPVGDEIGFGAVDSQATIVDSQGKIVAEIEGSKSQVASAVIAQLARRLRQREAN